MKVIKIKKPSRKGKPQEYRTIYAQTTPQEKKRYRSFAWLLSRYFMLKENNEVAHGFVSDRNCVTNAMLHVNKKYTLSLDLKSFFDYVSVDKLVKNGLPQQLADAVVYDGRARQGLSSSPMAANIAACGIDADILALIKDKGCVYTRYADDLSISCDDIEFLKTAKNKINAIVKKHNFKINHNKTRIQSSYFGRRIITGIAIDEECHATRDNKRKLRALKHKLKIEKNDKQKKYYEQKIRGLEEFIQCKVPNPPNEEKDSNRKTRFYPTAETISLTPAEFIDPSWVLLKKSFNFEIFRDVTNKIGIERCVKYLPHEVLDEKDGYRLLRITATEKRNRWRNINRIYLEMKNPSLEGVIHIESVHPRCRTVQDAINYRRYGKVENNPSLNWEPLQLS